MSRRFTRASAEYMTFDSATQPFQNLGFGTVAVVVQLTSDTPTPSHWFAFIGNDDSTDGDDGFSLLIEQNDELGFWGRTSNTARQVAGSAITSALGWVILCVTKTTGTTTPRGHIYVFSTNTWTHTDMNGTLANNANFSTPIWIGRGLSITGNFISYFDGHYAAAMCLNNHAMSDGEVERLARGRWAMHVRRGDDFLLEFPSGRDPVLAGAGASARALRANTMRSATVSGTSRSPITDPPGFRFSIDNRRR